MEIFGTYLNDFLYDLKSETLNSLLEENDEYNDLYDEVQSRIEGDKQLLNLIDNIKVGSVNDLSDLNNRLDTEIRNRIKNDEEIQNKINQKFAVSITPPLPVDGGIWFDIGASLIKYWNGDKWIPFCAVYK